ncbi:MAG: hypothetical protein WBQ45_15730 [Roseiarcus sp.]|jgi:hypothetical protein|uniref:bestrophin-like domain n=1 Tax=Roseiarcus sp. TaxID=1969460 RepID=UPI003BAFA580
MSAEKLAVLVALVVFAGGAGGLILQRNLPEHFTTGGPRDMIGAVSGLLTLLLALVLGLLIWTAYGVYSTQNVAVQTLAAKLLQLDLALTDYGSEADGGRAQLRQDLAKTLDQIWNADQEDAEFAAKNFSAAINNLRHKEGYLQTLTPSTDEQRQTLASATQTVEAIGQARLQMSFALLSPVSYPLLFMVVGWAVILFCAYGLMSKTSPMSFIALLFGAIAVASGVYLILDLSSPYSGIFRASPAPLEQVLAFMSQGQGTVGGRR